MKKFIAAKRTVVGGITFDSKLESRRYIALRNREAAGHISDLKRQVSYNLGNNRRYVADFVYNYKGAVIIEDVKSWRTFCLSKFQQKRKMMRKLGKPIKIVFEKDLYSL